MKKIVLIFALLSLPAFATDIPYTNDSYTSSTCDSGVLQHDSGTVRLRARYEPNTINIRWYNNNTEITPANTAANTCDYDDDLTLPNTQPTRTGYTFAGWRVRETMNFSSLSLSTGTAAYGKGTSVCYWYNPNESFDWQGGSNAACKTNSNFTELENHEWKTTYSNGTLYGMAHCSKKPGNNSSYTWPRTSDATIVQWQTSTINELDTYNESDAASEAKNCWRKATGYKSSSSAEIQGSASPLAWVFRNAHGSASYCASNCAYECANFARFYSAFRTALFLPIN